MEFIRRLFNRPRYPETRRVILNMKSGSSFSGILWEHRGPWLVVRQSSMLQDLGVSHKSAIIVDGEVAVLRSDVDFIQVM